jgi:hypothetical protein
MLTILLFFLLLIWNEEASSEPLRYNKGLSTEITLLLDKLLHHDKYDKRFRPNFGGK